MGLAPKASCPHISGRPSPPGSASPIQGTGAMSRCSASRLSLAHSLQVTWVDQEVLSLPILAQSTWDLRRACAPGSRPGTARPVTPPQSGCCLGNKAIWGRRGSSCPLLSLCTPAGVGLPPSALGNGVLLHLLWSLPPVELDPLLDAFSLCGLASFSWGRKS